MLAFARVFMGLRENRRNNADRAFTLLQMGIDAFEQLGNNVLSSVYSLYLLLYQTSQRNKDEIYEEAQKAYRKLSESEPGFFFSELREMLLGAVAIEAGKLETAEKLLMHSLNSSVEKNGLLLQTTTCMHLANLYYKMDKMDDFERFFTKSAINCFEQPILRLHRGAFQDAGKAGRSCHKASDIF